MGKQYPCPKCRTLEDIEKCCIKMGDTIYVHCLKCGVRSTKFDPKKVKDAKVQ